MRLLPKSVIYKALTYKGIKSEILWLCLALAVAILSAILIGSGDRMSLKIERDPTK